MQHMSDYLENGGTLTRSGRECNNISRMKHRLLKLKRTGRF